MTNISKLSRSALLLAMLALSACGGGGGDGSGVAANNTPGPGSSGSQNQSTTEVPESAGLGSSAFIAFLKTMMREDDTSDPMTMREGWKVPDDDVGDPQPMS